MYTTPLLGPCDRIHQVHVAGHVTRVSRNPHMCVRHSYIGKPGSYWTVQCTVGVNHRTYTHTHRASTHTHRTSTDTHSTGCPIAKIMWQKLKVTAPSSRFSQPRTYTFSNAFNIAGPNRCFSRVFFWGLQLSLCRIRRWQL